MAGDEIFCETFSIEAHLVYWCLNSHECSVDDVVSVALAFVSTVNIIYSATSNYLTAKFKS
jgi:hypothetical protein